MHQFQFSRLPGMRSRASVSRHVRFAKLAALFLTTVTGASLLPWGWELLRWAISHLPFLHPRSFPSLLDELLHPHWVMGAIWLAYYLLSYTLVSVLTCWLEPLGHADSVLTPRVYLHEPQQDNDLENSRNEAVSAGSLLYRSPEGATEQSPESGRGRRSHPLLSQAWPGEEKHDLVEQCYQQFRQALLRYDPPPLELKTLVTFFYHNRETLDYQGSVPVLPEAYLTAQRIGELRPMLAAHLYWYNLEILAPGGAADASSTSSLWSLFFFFTGNWLWLPTELCQSIASELRHLSASQYKALVLEADAFAVLLGQGPALERQLREVHRLIRARHAVEEHAPTLSERIGHLEALNKQERATLRALGLNVKEPRTLPPPEPPWPQLR